MAESESPAGGRGGGSASPGSEATLAAAAERVVALVGGAAGAIASRRGVPLSLAGGFVVLVAWIGERDSAWGFPVLIAGGLMIALGLLGPRLSGSLSLRWGEDGTFLELSSTVAPPGRRRRAPPLGDGPAGDQRERIVPPGEVEGDAETIDFKVEALAPPERGPDRDEG